MTRFLAITDHSVVKTTELKNLGHINVICGKNNSGKTTILEALCNNKHVSVGRQIDNAQYMLDIFRDQARGRAAGYVDQFTRWFQIYISREVENGTIWYLRKFEEIVANLNSSASRDQHLRVYNNSDVLRGGVDLFLRNAVSHYYPKLLPPKRRLEPTAPIALQTTVSTNGNGVINRLFYLKNQNSQTEENKCYEEIVTVFRKITCSDFQIVPDTSNTITLSFRVKDRWIVADQCGLGLSDVLVIVHQIVDGPETFLLIEEPENHLHAEFQKNLLAFMKSKKNRQFVISTHSSLFLDTEIADSVFYVSSEQDGIHVSDQTSKSEIIRSLGFSVSENLVSDIVVLTEGPSDIPVVRQLLSWLDVNDTFNVRFWPIGGDIMSEVDLDVFAENKKIFAVIDNDPGSSAQRTRFQRKCKEAQIPCCRLSRYSMENYFSLSALREVFKDDIPDSVVTIDPNNAVDSQLGFKTRKRSIKGRNREIIGKMSIEDFRGTDLLKFCEQMKAYLLETRAAVVF